MIDKRFPTTVKVLDDGVIYILVNTYEKWSEYQMMRTIPEDGKFLITFFDENDESIDETFDVIPGFRCFDYIITSSQEKDQITIVCVPRKNIRNAESRS